MNTHDLVTPPLEIVEGPEMVQRHEAAQYLGVHPSTIARWSKQGFLHPIKMPSGSLRFRMAELDDIKNGKIPTAQRQRDGTVRYPTSSNTEP